jgi:LVIVD repeat
MYLGQVSLRGLLGASIRKTLQHVGVLFVFFVGFLFFGPTTAFAQVTLSGTLYTDAGVTAEAAVKNIVVAVGTTTPGRFASTSVATTGAWSITIPVGHGIGTGTPLMVWVDGDVTMRATVVTKASSTATVQNITGLNLYQDRVIVRHEATSGTSTTNSDLGFYTAAQDSDLQHSTTSTGIVVASPNELYVWAGDTFAPGGEVTVAGNAGSSATEGSFYLDTSSIYTAGGALRLAGSLNAVSTATFTGGIHTTSFIATTTGKTINAPITSIGNVAFNGVGGEWTFTSAATTSALTVLSGTVTAPASTLGVTGTFQNDSTFLHNGGVVNIAGAATVALGDIARYVAGRDNSGSAAGTQNLQVSTMVVNGNFLYIGKAGNATACSNVAGSAVGCELMVFDISSTTNPTYIVGRDVTGNAAGTGNLAINNLIVMGNYLYVGKATNATACSNTAGSALGCELMVFDISSTTNPVYIVGRDSTGSAAGIDGTTGITNFATSTNMLYVSKTGSATACSQVAGSAVGCELMVFDVSSTTNPTYIAGRDVSGNAAGTQNLAINQIMALGSQLYVVKAANATACSQTAGSAVGCELMIYDISSTTNPTYIAGRDATGSATGTGNLGVTGLYAVNEKVYIGKAGDVTACSQTAGSAVGCELMIFDTSSTTNPIYVRGVDVAGSYQGVQTLAINNLLVRDNYLYAVKAASAIPCSQFTNQTIGCEILTFDISSSTAARLIAGRDAGGDSLGLQTLGATAVTSAGNSLFVSKGGSATACSNVAGSAIGCELMVFDVTTKAQGVLMGSLVATSSLGNLQATGVVEFRDSAQVGTITIASGTTTAPAELTVSGDFQNNAKFVANNGAVIFSSSSDQTAGGLLTDSSSFYRVIFSGTGTTTFSSNASTTFIDIQSGTVVAPSLLTVGDTLNNNGTFVNNGGHIQTQGYLNEFLYGLSAGGSASDAQGLAFNAFAQKDSVLYAAKAGSATGCSQTAGSAIGCELMVFDMSSSTNPVYVAGRDVIGSDSGTGNVAVTSLAVSGTTLYVGKAGNGTAACSQAFAAAIGCELMVYDISSSTNPVFVAGRDEIGTATGTGITTLNALTIVGTTLYVGKVGNSTGCNSVTGSALGCELMVFDISSTTNPVYVAGLDVGGNNSGSGLLNITSLTSGGTTLYVGKAGNATACSQVAGSALGCELMVFDISSTTNPVYVAGRDGTGSAAGAVSNPIQFIKANNGLLHVAKAGSATACSQVAGSATGCEYMIFNISSTTNPVYVAGRDVTGSAAGTGNVTANMVVATGTQAYLAKAGNATNCSQVVGSATGCELMMFDVSSTTNPLYALGRDSDSSLAGRSLVAVQSLQITDDTLVVGKALDTTVCEQANGQRPGCELALYKIPTSLQGVLTDLSSLATVTTNGITEINSSASTTNVFVASSSKFIAPSTALSLSEQLSVRGSYVHNGGELALTGTTNTVTTYATTTFYDFTKRATAAATTTFSTVAPFVILGNLTLQGSATATPLRLRSINSGTQWKIDPYSSTTLTLSLLDVKDSNNISATATPLVCGVGCRDSGNNSNWTIGVIFTIAGTLYDTDGVTPYATATPLRFVIPQASFIETATTTVSTGAYSIDVSDSFLTAGTPYIIFTDNTASVKANTITKSLNGGAGIAGLDLYRNHVILRGESGTSTPLSNDDLKLYTSTDDSDVQYTVDSGFGLQVTSPNALVVWDNSGFTPGGTVQVAGVSSTTLTVGSMYLRSGSAYTPANQTTLAGSLRASTTAVYNPGLAVLELNATTTGKVIDSVLPTLGRVRFDGTSGAWSFTQANATTSDFIVERGSVTAPSGVLTTTGVFINNATFNNNSGTVKAAGNIADDNARAATFVTGLDNNASKTGTQLRSIEALHVSGNYLYRGLNAGSSACSQTSGNSGVSHCEIAVFDISSTTNPIYRAGRDSSGSAAGTSGDTDVQDLFVSGNYLYVVKTASTTPCSQSVGAANGCELMVFDISSSTNPVYVAGRDGDGSASGSGAVGGFGVTVVGQYLYMTKLGDATACSQVAGSAIGCELMVFSISDPTNPTYVAGRDVSGSNAGTGNTDIRKIISGQEPVLYTVKGSGDATACSQVAGSAIGCELMVFSIASATNPVYVAGRDADGSSTGTDTQGSYGLSAANGMLALAKTGNATACSQVAGSATGCELMIFDISSSTNPVYRAGRDVSGSSAGTDALTAYSVKILGNNLIFGKFSDSAACSQTAGSAMGCEIMVFDISSTTNPVYVAGRDSSGDSTGVQGRVTNAIAVTDSVFYIGKNGQSSACSQVAGSAIGCELMVFTSLQPAGILSGNLTAGNSLSTLETSNITELAANASTTNITIATSSLLTSQNVSLTGNFSNSGTYQGGDSTTFWASSSATQNFTGSASSASTFGDLTIGGSGTKNVDLNATATDLIALSGTSVNYSGDLTVEGKYTNSGTVVAGTGSELILAGGSPINNYIAGRDVSGNAAGAVTNLMTQMVRRGDYLFIAKGFSGTACAQTVGGAQGCELHVYDVSSSTNPVFIAGRDSTGDSTGIGASALYSPVIVGDTLFVSKSTGDATACSQVAGSAIGCELMIFDITDPENPTYVAGRDASGSAAGTGSVNATNMAVVANMLFVLKEGNATACSQVAGSAIGCELMIFDISSTTNPIYVAGRDTSGNLAGTGAVAIEDILVVGSNLYISKGGDATACSQTAGSAIGCELMVFDISSTTNPIYVAGRDVSGDTTGTSSASSRRLEAVETTLYMIDETGNATACSQVAGSAIGCELRVFDISSSTNPVYVAGRDASGDIGGTGTIAINEVRSYGNYLYIAKNADATACSQVAGSAIGCELMIFDISSSTNPVYVAGRDASGNQGGTTAVIVRELHFYGTNLYVTKSGDATACSQTAGSAIGCELMVFNVGNILQGNMTGSSAHQAVTVRGSAEWYHNASTSDLTVAPTGNVTLPQEFTIADDFSNSGEFYANNGTVTLIGTDQQLTSSATTTFNNLIQIATTSATTSFSSTGGFVSTGMLQLQGTSPNRLKLRSTVDGAQWTILPQGSTSVAWLDVKDSRNSSSTVIECSDNCINRGNTVNWIFFSPLGTGTSTLAQHSAGQVSNKFSTATSTDEEMLAFEIETNSGSTTFSNLVFGLEGVTGVNPSDLTNFRLVRDHNSNKLFDGADILVGGVGDVVWSGDSAVLGFYESFMATSTFDYLVIADVAPVANGSFLTIGIGPNGISSVDSTGAQTILGSAVSFQHSRNNRGAGGGSSSIGSGAPVGDGDVGGGDTTGGELIGSDPDFFWPTSNSGSWINGAFAYDGVDGTYATTSGVANHSYTNHGFGIPGSNVIGGIEVKLELSGSTAAGTVDVQLSWDGGSNWTSTKSSPTLTTADVVRTLGSPSDLWGRTWTASEFGNANFAVRIAGAPSSNTIRLDAIQVRVYHVTGGGGSGGGGGI